MVRLSAYSSSSPRQNKLQVRSQPREVQRLQNELKAEIQKFDELSAELQRIKAGDLCEGDASRLRLNDCARLAAQASGFTQRTA